MRFTVGGESFDLTREEVIAAMEGVPSDPIQKHVVEVNGHLFPPKQVFATVKGRERRTFTTMEAQRVLKRLGFVCRRADDLEYGLPVRAATVEGPERVLSLEDRLASIEASVGTIEAAIAGLHARVRDLEALP